MNLSFSSSGEQRLMNSFMAFCTVGVSTVL